MIQAKEDLCYAVDKKKAKKLINKRIQRENCLYHIVFIEC